MTLAQALSFRAPWVNKPLRHMTRADWATVIAGIRRDQARIRALYQAEMWTTADDKQADAAADRLADLCAALKIIMD